MIRKLVDNINVVIEYFVSVMMVLMAVIVLAQIFFRAAMNISLSWTTELSTFLFSWIVFFGAAIGFKKKAHFSVDMFTKYFPKPVIKVLPFVINLLITVFLLVLIKFGFDLVSSTANQVSPSMGIPMSIMYSVVPIGSIIMLIYLWTYRKEEEE